jgi:HD-GYP domain-containing protein (c-di-GMP phosphodiesterase class II)
MTSTESPSELQTARKHMHELKSLAVVLREEFDTPFRFYDTATGERIVVPDHDDSVPDIALVESQFARELATDSRPKVMNLSDNRHLLGFPLDGIGPPNVAALGVLSALARSRSELDQERARIGKWIGSLHERLRSSREMSDRRQAQSGQDRQSMIAWDAMMALDRLHGNLQIHKEPARNKTRVLRTARELLGATSIAWVSLVGDSDVVCDGEKLFSPWEFGQIADQLADENVSDQSGYVIVNDPRESRWGARFPRMSNVLAVPLVETTISGWVLAFNKQQATGRGPLGRDRRAAPSAECNETGQAPILPFRRWDAALLMPFASLLGLQARASQRFVYVKNAMEGLTRSLTASIDAKDEYTYGHSERVARAAVELGRELGLRDSELNDIYLAGLLHDIGKIGIRDDVLTKRGPLTDEEFKHIQQHPVIGHRILAGVDAIAHLLPGVLHHHERYDGRGYPHGMSGDSIPMLARILAVADSFDAMNTSRPYRLAMPAERVDQILREGASTQWDPVVIEAYTRCRDRLIAIRQHGLGESLRNALDGAMRNGMGQGHLASQEFSIIH